MIKWFSDRWSRATKWLKDKLNKFNDWMATWAPGAKTKIASGLGAVSMFAAMMQEYISGLPLDKFITGTQVAVLSAVLFTLAFWFRGLTSRA